MFPSSFDHPPAPEVFLQELRELRKKSSLFPRSALEKGSLFLPGYSQPYVFRDRAHKFTEKARAFPLGE